MMTARKLPMRAIATLLCGTGLVLSGCASTAKGSSASVFTSAAAPAKYLKAAPETDALVVVRYPAVLDNTAKDSYFKAFRSNPIGGSIGRSTSELDTDQVAESVIIKSNYFAMSVYKELADRLPKNTVLLSPHTIELDGNGNLTSSPIGSMEKIPGAVSVDFTAYTFPNPDKMMGGKPVTFGDLITPLVVVHADHRGNAATNGLIMASEPVLKAAYSQATSSAANSFKTIQSGALMAEVRPLDFISHLNGMGTTIPAAHKINSTRNTNSVEIYPLEKLRFSQEDMIALSRNTDGLVDPAKNAFSAKVANHIIKVLNKTDIDKAGMVERAAAISRYDNNLAPFALAGATDQDLSNRMRMSSKLIAKERDVLAAQSNKIYEATYLGESGKQMREMLKTEYRLLEDRRKIAKQQNMMTTMSILGAVAAVGVASSGNGNSNTNAQMANLIADLTTIAAARALALRDQSKAMGRNFNLAMAPALQEQISVQVDLLDGSETISAASFAELQGKMQELYSKRVRAMEAVASECSFSDNSGATGRWLGECASGVAEGHGVGTVKRADGTAVEYYGEASGGMANGVGYQIVQARSKPYSYEGQFVGGKPTGAIAVSKSGVPAKVHMFENGVDKGRSAAGTVAPKLYRAQNYGISGA
jgi:hypothetical protein